MTTTKEIINKLYQIEGITSLLDFNRIAQISKSEAGSLKAIELGKSHGFTAWDYDNIILRTPDFEAVSLKMVEEAIVNLADVDINDYLNFNSILALTPFESVGNKIFELAQRNDFTQWDYKYIVTSTASESLANKMFKLAKHGELDDYNYILEETKLESVANRILKKVEETGFKDLAYDSQLRYSRFESVSLKILEIAQKNGFNDLDYNLHLPYVKWSSVGEKLIEIAQENGFTEWDYGYIFKHTPHEPMAIKLFEAAKQNNFFKFYGYDYIKSRSFDYTYSGKELVFPKLNKIIEEMLDKKIIELEQKNGQTLIRSTNHRLEKKKVKRDVGK